MPSTTDCLSVRQYAHPFDRPIKGDQQTHGVCPSPDAIGGYYGIGWYETFRDHRTNELFRVHCSDGVYNGKSSHSGKDLGWMESCRRDIIERTQRTTTAMGCKSVSISSAEWAVMVNFTFGLWLDLLPGEAHKTVGDANRHLDCGQIGTINGIPVIVDPRIECPLPSPPSDQRSSLTAELAQIDAEEDQAEALGY